MKYKRVKNLPKKQRLAVLLLFLACLLTGCGAEQDEADTDRAEAVVLTMFVENPSRYTGLQEDPVAAYIEERFGIRVELTANDLLCKNEDDQEMYQQLLKAKLDSNDLDDIMDFGPALEDTKGKELLQKAAKSGRLVALDELIREYAPNIANDERIKVRNAYRKEYIYEDGKLYSLGSQGGVSRCELPENSQPPRGDLCSGTGGRCGDEGKRDSYRLSAYKRL